MKMVAKHSLEFQPVQRIDSNVHVLGSLLFDRRDELGSRAVIDLTDTKCHKALARDLIAALDAHATESQVASAHSVPTYKASINELLAFAVQIGASSNFRLMNVDTEFLLNFRAHLKVTMIEQKSGQRRRRFGNIIRLIEAGQEIGLANRDLQTPRNFRHLRDSDRTQPYTAGEALDIEAACRDRIRELLDRLEDGKRLLAEGMDPRGAPARDSVSGRILKVECEDRAWNQLSNLLWYVVNILDGKKLKASELQSGKHFSFANAVNGTYGGVHRKPDIYGHLYPLAKDLIPFIVLLAKKTGRNEFSILGLRRDCLTEINGRHFLWYEKKRGEKRLYKKAIDDNGPFSPVALIKTLQRITEPLAKIADSQYQDNLLLGLTIRGHGREPIKDVDPSYILFQMNRTGGWCDQNELLDSKGQRLRTSFRSMRVFYLTDRYKKTGQLSKVSRDAVHSMSNTTVSYLDNDSTKHIHELAIEAGIEAARAIAKPTVIVGEEAQSKSDSVNLDLPNTKRILEGAQDVYFASCKDFYNRPGGKAQTACDKPWECLTCRNAIITRHVLPRLVSFRNFISQQRAELSEADWNEKFGAVWTVICNDVLPKFSTEVLKEAERLAFEQVLYIPLALKVA